MANIILIEPISSNSDKFNVLVNLSFNSKKCCCDNKYLKLLYSIFSMQCELERYYKHTGDIYFPSNSFIALRKDKIYTYIDSSLKSICDNVSLLDNITDNDVSYADLPSALSKLSRLEYKLNKSKCWCNILKTTLAFQISQTEFLTDILDSANMVLLDKIISQSTTHFIPTVNTITVNNQVL